VVPRASNITCPFGTKSVNSQFSGDPVSIAFLVWLMISSFVFFFI